jgi:hypothetical protein
MQTTKVNEAYAEVVMAREEIRILTQALNEILNGMGLPEFDDRMGASRSEVATLLGRLDDLYVDMKRIQ